MNSFIHAYTGYLKTRTDAPPEFHVHAAMASLAYALGSNCWTDGRMGNIYPNLWIAIIAKSGMGKSVPLNLAENLIRLCRTNEGMLPASFSQEALLATIQKTPTSIFILQEFSAFIRQLEREYNAGAMAWLTELYDVPPLYPRTIMRKGQPEVINLVNPCITILAASSPDWFAESFKQNQLTGGFLGRFLFCPSDKRGEYVGYPGPRDQVIESALAGHLEDVHSLRGKFDMSGVREQYDAWERPRREALSKTPPEFVGMRSRAGTLVMKAAMLFHVSSNVEDLVLTAEDMEMAIKYVEGSHDRAEKFLAEEIPSDADERDLIKIIRCVERLGGKGEWGKVMMNTHLSARKMAAAVDTATQSDRLQVETINRARYLYLPLHEPEPPSTNGTH